ncbi:uncharacterized protein [Hyperolius riggenbachi]|uniref:uncharacterized protein isoform X1 n=1 Tax=Hyperolius riggenbachi TaxID=752182 RepID=UPI0035A2AB87
MSNTKGSKADSGAVKGQTGGDIKEQPMPKITQQEQPADQKRFSNDKNEAKFNSQQTFNSNMEKSITGNKVSTEMSEEKHRGIQEPDINHKGFSRHHEEISKLNDKQLQDPEKAVSQQYHQNEPQNRGRLRSPEQELRTPTQPEELKKTNVKELSKIQQAESAQLLQESSSKTHQEDLSMSFQESSSKSHQEETSTFHQERSFQEESSKSNEDGSSKSKLEESFKSTSPNSFQEDHFREGLSKPQQKGTGMPHQKKLLNTHQKQPSLPSQGDPSKNQAELDVGVDKYSNKTILHEAESQVPVKDGFAIPEKKHRQETLYTTICTAIPLHTKNQQCLELTDNRRNAQSPAHHQYSNARTFAPKNQSALLSPSVLLHKCASKYLCKSALLLKCIVSPNRNVRSSRTNV